MPLSLGQATIDAIASAGAGDLEALSRALADRDSAMANATEVEMADAVAAGETIGRLLAELRRNLVLEQNRLEQFRLGFAQGGINRRVNLQA